MITRNRSMLALGAIGLGAMLTGCTSVYTADVRNMTDQPITVAVSEQKTFGSGKLLQTARIGPGDRDTLGGPSSGKVFLEVDFAGNLNARQSMRLRKGLNTINVERNETGTKGSIRLTEVGP